jgi:putative regulator of septum formation
MRVRRVLMLDLPIAIAIVMTLAGCSLFGSNNSGTKKESVFSVKVGQCFDAPTNVKAQLSSLSETPCTRPHTQEAYAVVPFQSTTGATSSAYPGDDVLSTFSQGACAQRYSAYVGVDYLDSKLFFTYLLPSARSWEQDSDRSVICFVTTTGAKLTSSVKGTKQ